jgi:hypothetical protein
MGFPPRYSETTGNTTQALARPAAHIEGLCQSAVLMLVLWLSCVVGPLLRKASDCRAEQGG